MDVKLIRFSASPKSTLGLLFIDNVFQCYTLEDEYRPVKVKHETRIPEGVYKLTLSTWGNHHARYAAKFGAMHKGMIVVNNVPGFSGILIHMGNKDDHTSGCILVGMAVNNNKVADGLLLNSEEAYRRIYKTIATAISVGQSVNLSVENIEPVTQ